MEQTVLGRVRVFEFPGSGRVGVQSGEISCPQPPMRRYSECQNEGCSDRAECSERRGEHRQSWCSRSGWQHLPVYRYVLAVGRFHDAFRRLLRRKRGAEWRCVECRCREDRFWKSRQCFRRYDNCGEIVGFERWCSQRFRDGKRHCGRKGHDNLRSGRLVDALRRFLCG